MVFQEFQRVAHECLYGAQEINYRYRSNSLLPLDGKQITAACHKEWNKSKRSNIDIKIMTWCIHFPSSSLPPQPPLPALLPHSFALNNRKSYMYIQYSLHGGQTRHDFPLTVTSISDRSPEHSVEEMMNDLVLSFSAWERRLHRTG